MTNIAHEIETIARQIEHDAAEAFARTRDSSVHALANTTVNKLKRIAQEVRRLESEAK
jgi:hypothetical protein